jgi:bla regulator protein blaR1
MIGEVTNHLWQSTFFAVAAILLSIVLREARAQIRYWLWLSASFKFLVPFSLLMELGHHLEWAQPAQKIATIPSTVAQIAQPFPDGMALTLSTPNTVNWLVVAGCFTWACGFGVIVLIRLRAWLRIRAAVEHSIPADIPAKVPVRSSPGLLDQASSVFCIPLFFYPPGSQNG